MKKKLLLALLATLLVAAGALLLIEREPPPPSFDDIPGVSLFSPAVEPAPFSLTRHDGQPFTRSDLEGHWSLAFFGYTHCPDVCPNSLAIMKRVATRLRASDSEGNTRYLFFSLDPFRDTPQVIADYLAFFDPAFIGLVGEKNEIDRLAESVGVIYDYEGDVRSDDFIVNHYAAILVFDPRGRLRAHILPPHTVEKVATVFERLRQHYGE